jgi:AmiR/NasT family two-component response regulator
MIVEDQVILAMDLEMVLSDAGCDVVGCALDREGAFGVGERERPNLAFVDVNLLDGRTGPQIARRLVEEYGTAVVFLTANPEQIPAGFAGALGAVTKPFDETTIRAVVSFAREFIFLHTVGEAPGRLQLAPWLTTQQSVAHH